MRSEDRILRRVLGVHRYCTRYHDFDELVKCYCLLYVCSGTERYAIHVNRFFIVLHLVSYAQTTKKGQSRKCVNNIRISFLNRHSGHCHVSSSIDWDHLSNPSLAYTRQDVMMNESCKKSPSSEELNWSSFFTQTSMLPHMVHLSCTECTIGAIRNKWNPLAPETSSSQLRW